jgi:hypothetical protein
MVARLTDLEARRAKPRATAYKLAAGDGLCLVVMPGGGKYWWLRYRFAGREKTFSIGVYPGVSLRETESAAQKARALLRNDIDPTEDRRARKFALRMNAENTFGAAAELWVKHNTPRWKPATLEKVRQYLDKDLLPPLGRRPLANITPMELGAAVAKIEARKAHNVAKKTRQWLSKVFQFAIAKGMTSSNPAEFLARSPRRPRNRNASRIYRSMNCPRSFKRSIAIRERRWGKAPRGLHSGPRTDPASPARCDGRNSTSMRLSGRSQRAARE